MRSLLLLCGLCLLWQTANAANAEQWRHKVIYQLMTDRFATTNGSTPYCDIVVNDYCGGTWRGIASKLDYLVELGVDAIWISPINENFPKGYHGYWAKSIYRTNPYFGEAEDLKYLTSEAHKRGLLVMADVVANHMGFSNSYANISEFDPFNDPSHYHGCVPCDPDNCWVFDYANETQLLYCRLFGLPDLNQTNPYVNETLLNWIHDLVQNYSFDGLRIDTVPYVFKWFWGNFSKYAGVYTMGEVADGRIEWVSGFQGYLDGLLNFPMYYTLNNAFKNNGSMKDISTVWRRENGDDFYPTCGDSGDGGNGTDSNDTDTNTTSWDPYNADWYEYGVGPAPSRRLLQSSGGNYPSGGYGNNTNTSVHGSGYFPDIGLNGNFIENHDFGRFLDQFPVYNAYRNVLVWIIAAQGIPILYYGSEQGYNGGHEPYCREALWDSGYQTDGAWQGYFKFIQRMLLFRKSSGFYVFPHSELYIDDNSYIFARGHTVIATTNIYKPKGLSKTSKFNRAPWRPGTYVCDILSDGTPENEDNCFTVDDTGYVTINFYDGEPRIYSPDTAAWPWKEEDSFIVTDTIFYALVGIFVVFAVIIIWRCAALAYSKEVKLRRTRYSSSLKKNKDRSEEILLSDPY